MTRSDRTRGRTFGCLAMPLALFAGLGALLWGWDATRLLRWRPVPAFVEHSGIAAVRGSRGGRTWSPDVRYRYVVGGATHVGRRVLPGGESRGEGWARSLAERFPAGASVTAYVNPSAPDDAFLLRRPSAGAYLFVVAPLLVALLLRAEAESGSRDAPPPRAPTRDDAGRFTLASVTPAASARRRARAARRAAAGSIALLAPYLILTVLCAAGERGLGAMVSGLVGPTLGDGFFVFESVAVAAMVWWQARRARTADAIAHTLRRVDVAIDRAVVRVDAPFSATVDVALVHDAHLERLLVGLRRDSGFTGRSSRAEHAVAWASLIGPPLAPTFNGAEDAVPPLVPDAERVDVDVRTDGIVGCARFRIPAALPPSTTEPGAQPYTRWSLVVRTSLAGSGHCDVAAPLHVQAFG